MDILAYCGMRLLLSLTILDDRPDKGVSMSDISSREDLRISPEVFFMLAYQGRLRHLIVESIFVPLSLQSHPNPLNCNPGPSFTGLYSLRTPITADLVWCMLSLMPTVKDLSLDVVDSDPASKVVHAAASLLPRLSVLKMSFWSGFDVKAERDLGGL